MTNTLDLGDLGDLEDFEQALLDLQERALGVADLIQAPPWSEQPSHNCGDSYSDSGNPVQRFDVTSSDSGNQLAVLNLIAQALQRIDEGGFGVCLKCHESVGFDRLQKDPTQSVCLNCEAG